MCTQILKKGLVLLVQNTFKLFGFQSFDFERNILFQKRVVRTKFSIYVYIEYRYTKMVIKSRISKDK